THALLWWVTDNPKLSAKAKAAMKGSLDAGEELYYSAWSFVELWYATEKPPERPDRVSPERYRHVVDTIQDPESGFIVIHVDGPIAVRVSEIPREWTSDPGDRVIIATAQVLGATLVTRDTPHRFNADIDTLW
ncbi:MAG: type II toxin-antitoxin system VapC family toxin, partial [Frankiaceae bacterium]|nr:type II toxin-antitoxin system VapC family toxin [Frankiaceae bacterium]